MKTCPRCKGSGCRTVRERVQKERDVSRERSELSYVQRQLTYKNQRLAVQEASHKTTRSALKEQCNALLSADDGSVTIEVPHLDVGDITVRVDEGTFVLENAVLEIGALTPVLRAHLVNRTEKNWDSVMFEIQIYDTSGKEVHSATYARPAFSVGPLAKGQGKAIDEPLRNFDSDRIKTIGKVNVQYRTGAYPAKYKFAMTKPHGSSNTVFEDKSVRIFFDLSARRIRLKVHNKTRQNLELKWDEAGFVDVGHLSHKVVHSGVNYMDKDKPQAPTVVAPGTTIEDTIVPKDYINEISGKWTQRPLFPTAPEAKAYKGRTFSVLLPLSINSKVKTYQFAFKIQDVEM